MSKITTVHFSIDDTIMIFDDLTINENKYSSIFENDNLKYLKLLHDKYGIKVTFYVFYEFAGKSLEDTTNKFRHEFEENNNWLKFGFHAYNNTKDYSIVSLDEIYKDYSKTISKLKEIVGEESISSVVRLEKFICSKENASKLAQIDNGITGLLGADTMDRNNYYLGEDENKELFNNDYLYDKEIKVEIYNTDLRIENMNGSIYNEDCFQDEILVIFTHEWQLNEDNKNKIEELFRLLKNASVRYSFLERK